jgi:hypothetical protein
MCFQSAQNHIKVDTHNNSNAVNRRIDKMVTYKSLADTYPVLLESGDWRLSTA